VSGAVLPRFALTRAEVSVEHRLLFCGLLYELVRQGRAIMAVSFGASHVALARATQGDTQNLAASVASPAALRLAAAGASLRHNP
jgi:hypothetical protein